MTRVPHEPPNPAPNPAPSPAPSPAPNPAPNPAPDTAPGSTPDRVANTAPDPAARDAAPVALLTGPVADARVHDAAARVLDLCPAVARAMACELGAPAGRTRQLARLADWAAAPWSTQRLAQVWQQLGGPDAIAVADLGAALRRLRRQVVAGVAVRDVAGLAPLEEVTGTMTALADLAVTRGALAIGRDLAGRHGVPHGPDGQPQDLLVVAMGKGGGGELNVSSDLDLVFAYAEDGQTRAPDATADGTPGGTPDGRPLRPLTNGEFFARMGRGLAALLSDVTAEGFVFRVDLRLRPNGDAGPLVVSGAMLEEYLLRQGRAWERFAWLKARVVCAPVFTTPAAFEVQARGLAATVLPFVYRRYLDFGAISALRDLHRLIRAESARKAQARAQLNLAARGQDIKLGRGGIREIEFIAQTFQVIRGGRDARLRALGTLTTLGQLGALGVLDAVTCARLHDAYVLLRRIEHALQYVDDAQTHLLPADERAVARIATLLRLGSAAELQARLLAATESVAAAFDDVFAEPVQASDATIASAWLNDDTAALVRWCAGLGYARAADTVGQLQALRASRRVALLAETSRRAVDRLLVRAVETIGQRATETPHEVASGPDEVVARLVRLLEVIVTRSTYIAMLNEHPAAFARVLRVLAAGPFPNDYLRNHPVVLDELLDVRLEQREPDWPRWAAELDADLRHHAADPERQMNLLRDAHHGQVFRLLLADLDGRLELERLADHLSRLADVVLALTLACAWSHLPRRHRPEPAFAIVGYGKLGGRELGYASDLDLIYVFDDPHPEAAERYALLVRRLMTWLTSHTSSGVLFDVDLRLRPNGNAGLLVSGFDAFERYQCNDDRHGAWTWEHQALTRARFCAGDAALGARIEALRAAILARPRDPVALRADVLQMRQKMHDGHPNRTAQFDPKHDRGGMVDVEFAVQFIVLRWAHAHPALLRNAGNIALLGIAGSLGIVDTAVAGQAAAAYRRLRQLQHRLRLSGAGEVRVAHAEVAEQIAAVEALWRAVFGAP